MSQDGSGFVSQWADQPSNGFLATQLTAGKQPLWVDGVQNGRPALRFDGDDTFSVNTAGPGGTQITVFIVAKGKSYEDLVCYATNNDAVIYPWRSESGQERWMVGPDGAFNNSLDAGLVAGEWNVGVAKWAAGQANGMATWRNGVLVAERDAYTTTMPTVPLWIGSGQGLVGFTEGDVAEILVYDVGLSDADRTSVQEYLSQKYALPGGFIRLRLRVCSCGSKAIPVSGRAASMASMSEATREYSSRQRVM